MAFVPPLVAIAFSFGFLAIMLYKRVNLGITLAATALLLALLATEWRSIPSLVYDTSVNPLTISVVSATFLIMWLSQLYKETGFVDRLSESLGKIIKDPKLVLCVLPAIIGFLPVAGGALMSAPLVETQGEKLKLSNQKKAYVNLWFRHTIFPVYPLSQVLIVAAGLAGTTVPAIILRQIPVVAVMVALGYIIGFRNIQKPVNTDDAKASEKTESNLRAFLLTFSPIIASIVTAVILELVAFDLARLGFDVLVATTVGILVIVALSKPSIRTFAGPLGNPGIYGITLAAYAAFLLGNVMKDIGISETFKTVVANGTVNSLLLIITVPAVLGVLTASALGGISISIPLLREVVPLSTETASMIFMSAYLGYVISPTHLCLAFTARYFKSPLGKLYRYLLPSFAATYATAILIHMFL